MNKCIPLKHQINYQPKCLSFLDNFIVYGAEFPDFTTKIIVLRIHQNKPDTKIIDNNNESLNFLKIMHFNEQKVIVALFESYLRVFTIDGKILYSYQNYMNGNLVEFEDVFSAATVLRNQTENTDIFVICTETGYFYESHTKLLAFQEKCKLDIKPTALIAKSNRLIAADQIGFLFKFKKNYEIQDKLNLKTGLPTYLIEKIEQNKTNLIILGSCNGEIILVTQNFRIATRLQCHANLITSLVIIGNRIVSGSEDGCINQLELDSLKPMHTLQTNKIVTGIYYIEKKFLVSYYDYSDLFKL